MTVRWLATAATFVALASTALADPTLKSVDLDQPTRVSGDGRVVPRPSASERDDDTDVGPDLHDYVQLSLPRLSALDTSFHDPFLSEVAMYEPIPGSLIVQYRGLQGYVMKRLRHRFRKEWRKQFKAMDKYTSIDAFELADRYERMYEQIVDFRSGGQWWTRTWWQSLPADQGGAPTHPYFQQIGERIKVLELGPLSVTNDFRGRIDSVGVISFAPDSGHVFRTFEEERSRLSRYARLTRSVGDDDVLDEDEPLSPEERRGKQRVGPHAAERLAPLDTLDVIFDVKHATSWFEGMRWRVRFRPGLRVKLRTQLDQMNAGAYLRTVFDLEVGKQRLRAVRVETKISYRVMEREFRAEFQIQLLSW